MKYKIINTRKRIATAAADMIGSALYAPARLFRGATAPIDHASVREILLIRTAYIGDMIMTIPMLAPLKRRYPDARITVLTSRGGAQMLKGNPHAGETLAYEPFWFYPTPKSDYSTFIRTLKSRSFDMVIEARADIREILMLVRPLKARYKVSYSVGGGAYMLTHVVPYPGLKHKVQYHLDIARYLGCDAGDDAEWGLYITEDELTRARELLASAGAHGDFIAVHPGSRLALKRWAGFGPLCDRIARETGMQTVLLGAESERPIVDEVIRGMSAIPPTLCGRMDIRTLAAVIKLSRAMVCHDSAPMHMAAAEGVPTVAIFGPSKSSETAPYGAIHHVVEKPFACRETCDESTCANPAHHACMRAIGEDDIMSALVEALKR